MSNTDDIISRLDKIIELLSANPQTVQPSPRPASHKRVELVLKITSTPREYGQGKGDFYDAFDGDGNAISLGVSRQRVNGRTFSIGDAIHCFADDVGENRRGIPTFFLSSIVIDNQPAPSTKTPSQEGNDVPF